MSTSNRSVKAVLLPRPPIRTKEPGKLRVTRNTNTDIFLGMLKRSFCLSEDSNIVLSEDGCLLAAKDFIAGCVEYCNTGKHDIPADSATYDDAEGKATVEIEVTVIEGKPGLANSTDNEEKEGGGSQKPGAKKGKRAPYLESMQRNLQKFMPLTSEGVYLLAKATTNDEELINWFNEARDLFYLHTILELGGQFGWSRQLFMDRLNKRLHHLNKKPETARPPVSELQDCFAKREKTALMRKVEASRHEIQLCCMKGLREVMDRNSGPKSGEQANTYFQISDRSATDAGGGAASNVPDREDCRAPTPRFNEDALKEYMAARAAAQAEKKVARKQQKGGEGPRAPFGKGKGKRAAAAEETAPAPRRKMVKRLGKAMVDSEAADTGPLEDAEDTSSSESEDKC